MPGTLGLAAALSLFAAWPQADTVPLFASAEPLELTLVADLEAIRRDRAEDPEDRPGLMILADGDTVAVELRPRGDFRRDPANCSFPPLRLDVQRRSAEGTVFRGQDKLKMVVPCRPEQSAYEQYVLLEYGIYRAFEVLSYSALHTRLARMTFVDTGGGRPPFTAWGFLIEEDGVMAARLGGALVDMPEGAGVRPQVLNPRQSTLVALFQYMVGNSDWSDFALHNVKLVQGVGLVVPVPYDFDIAGLVNARYALPDPLLGIRNVRERIYRGWCFDAVDRDALVASFIERRAEVEAAVTAVPGLDAEHARDAAAYLAGFFDDVATPDRAARRVFRDCRPIS